MSAGDAWRPWPKASPELLAHFVNIDAVRAALPRAALTSVNGVTLHDLRNRGNLADVVGTIYDLLCNCAIAYDLEPVLLDDPGDHFQRIRPPQEVIGGKGTCIDLALLFAGACIEARLLPCIVLLRNSARAQFHALVAVDAVYTHDQWNSPRGWTQADAGRGWIESSTGAALWRLPEGALWQRVLNRKCILVECTGFAAAAADERNSATLSFRAAQDAAASNIGAMEHLATIDIVRLQKGKSYGVYDPHRGVAPALHEIITRDYPALADSSYAVEFGTLIAQEAQQFVGRSWVAEQLEEFRNGCSSGYFCFVADAGLGKTAIAARIAQDQQAPAFFFSAAEGRTDLESCLRHLSVELISRFALPHAQLPPRSGKDWAFLKTLLGEVSRKSPRLLIVIDGIDEAAEAAGGNTLFLPAHLPAGVHIVLSSRLEPILHVSGGTRARLERLAANDRRQLRDIDEFLERQAARPELLAWLARRNLKVRTFLDRLREASAGNFMYLTYVLDDVVRNPEGTAYLREDQLPAGLTNYYERFWRAMERAKDTDGWRDWNELYRPTIALLAAAAEPVTAEWLSSIIAKSAEEITERALTPWKRFLRHHDASGRWWIVHKSFADFLVGGNRLDIRKAHQRIADHYLDSWCGAPRKLAQLPTPAPIDELSSYGLRHIAQHLRYGGNHDVLQEIICDPDWYSWRLAQDPSGDRFHFDALQALAASQAHTQREIGSGRSGTGIAREVSCLLALGTSNSLSSNLPGALPAALVQCGHWQPDIALRAIRLNPEPAQRQEALAALAPLLDEPHISEALHQARAEGTYPNQGLREVLRRLCILEQAERVLAEVERLSEHSQDSILSELAEVLPEQQLGMAIERVGAHYRRRRADILSGSEEDALAALLSQAPALLLPSVLELPERRNGVSSSLLGAVALRWGALNQFARCEAYLEKMHDDSRVAAIAQLVPLVPASQAALRAQFIARSLPHLATLYVAHRVNAMVALAGFIEQDRLRELAREVLTRETEKSLNPAGIFRTLSPVLPAEMLEEAAAIADRLDEYDRGEAYTSLALRAVTLDRPQEAVELARAAGNSYYVGQSFVHVLPRLAETGHAAIAVRYAEKADQYGRDEFVPATLIGVSKHVAGPTLDQLRERAKLIRDDRQRRAALLGIAARYAQLNNPTEALSLARLIDDAESCWSVRASIALSWLSEIRQPERALAEAWKLPAPWAWRTIEAMADQLSTETLRSLLARSLDAANSKPRETDEYFARRYALVSLLQRLAASGSAAEALAFAELETGTERYVLLAAVAPYLDETAKALRLERALEELTGTGGADYIVSSALGRLAAELGESSLRKFESALVRRDDSFDMTKTIALRYARLGRLQDALRVAANDYQKQDLYLHIVPHLDASAVHDLLERLELFTSDRDKAIRRLLARLAELGEADEAMQRIGALQPVELRFAAIAGAATHAPREMLERLEPMVFGKATAAGRGKPDEGAAEAVAAIAARYGELGDTELAVSMLQQVSWNNEAISKALVCMAGGLSGEAIEKAIDIAMRLESENWPDPLSNALSALLPILARHDDERAMQIAAQVSETRSRRVALGSVTRATAGATALDRHKMWAGAAQFTARRARRQVFGDLEVLMPLIGELGGAAALEQTAVALDRIIKTWP